MREKLEKIVKFLPSFNKIDPDPSKNYGVGAVKCYMVLKGKKGAVHFVFSTGMYLPSVYEYWKSRDVRNEPNKPDYMGCDVGYHSPKPQFKGQEISQKKCDWLDGKPCYCDGSALRADGWMKIFVEKGDDEIWKMLKEYYNEIFKS